MDESNNILTLNEHFLVIWVKKNMEMYATAE